MDVAIAEIAQQARDLLTPYLPYLLPVAAGAGKAALKRAGDKIGDATWNKAEALWSKLWPGIQERPSALEAARDLAAAPDDSDAQGAFGLQLKKMLAEDSELAKTVQQFLVDSSVRVTASGDRSVAATNVTNSIISTGDRNGR
jgi:hypothetical protein